MHVCKFKIIISIIVIIGPSIADGGPGLNGWVDQFPWLQAFVEHAKDVNTLPDILTWYRVSDSRLLLLLLLLLVVSLFHSVSYFIHILCQPNWKVIVYATTYLQARDVSAERVGDHRSSVAT